MKENLAWRQQLSQSVHRLRTDQSKKSKQLLELIQQLHPRKIKRADRGEFEQRPRGHFCLQFGGGQFNQVKQINHGRILERLAFECESIEHQIHLLRWLLVDPSDDNFLQRKEFTRYLLDCLYAHHGVVYQGILFGSSVNGLGFIDSDIDMRLRPLKQISKDEFEPIEYDQDKIGRVLKNIAYRTTCCSPAIGAFVPSSRCPIAKLKFINGLPNIDNVQEGWSYDISLSTSSPLGSLNSHYIRFLCNLQPKFHHLAIAVRYWAKVHDLIKSGLLSSYALITMLVYFCQTLRPPLLPTVNEMRDKYLLVNERRFKDGKDQPIGNAITNLEWQCIMDLDRSAYEESNNTDPLCLLLLKFFEFYLKFPYAKNIITVRTGGLISFDDFPTSPQFHRKFPLKQYINIQDPFDLKHNLTAGMGGSHFQLIMKTMRCSYDKLASEINDNFQVPLEIKEKVVPQATGGGHNLINWGLNSILTPMTNS